MLGRISLWGKQVALGCRKRCHWRDAGSWVLVVRTRLLFAGRVAVVSASRDRDQGAPFRREVQSGPSPNRGRLR